MIDTQEHERANVVREAYAALREDFARWTPSTTFRDIFQATVIAEVRRRLAGGEAVRVMEVGCGHATWAEEMYRALAGPEARIDYVGIDFTPERVELGRRRLARVPSARLLVADANEFDTHERFDLVLAIEVLQHVDPRRYETWLARWRDWLRPGGAVVVIDKERYSAHALRVRMDLARRRWLPDRLRRSGYYFPEPFTTLMSTLAYPAFGGLRRLAARLGYTVRPIVRRGVFRALIAAVAQ